jgi:tRNA threonylcarbamoyladenosine biosynthesis protein TsaB
MRILAIDTSTRTGSIALLQDGVLIAEISSHEETPYSTRLFRDLEWLKRDANFTLSQIDIFAVTAGPGSFTGLRIGLTAVKAWAEIHEKPIAAISGLEAIAMQSRAITDGPAVEDQIVAPFFDARRGQLFGCLYRRSAGSDARLDPISPETIFSPQEFIELVKGSLALGKMAIVSPAPDLLPGGLMESNLPGIRVESVSAALAGAVGRLGYERALRGELLDALRLDANYVRRSDAESAWSDGK